MRIVKTGLAAFAATVALSAAAHAVEVKKRGEAPRGHPGECLGHGGRFLRHQRLAPGRRRM